ncbi:sugar O-acetyltransferase [Lawsonella clevelandensis]|uniref:Acetyltransferase n=2 Tax=Lawsonella clevelandensis TaxID=1528099 RepID=A0A0M4LZ36_9ACTN|nr:sugar O-acetyltransferase [Lawsonella clevelandensis]ALE18907.1 hypothetical protein AL705_03760 [Lawsonella clevelandensis]ALE34581.1 hypothetical protein IY73_03660 [Lawsonella clevelandensis]MDU7193417.1 sugar O-acetyltransferase [Lawsonella clevelandensis]VHO00419.1 Putative acetyltransferase [Lawsonella clevelandensis]
MGLHLERMLAGEWYNPAKDPDLADAYMECQRELARFNATGVEEDALRAEILRGLWGEFGEGSVVRQPLVCEFGFNIRVGRGCFVNFDVLFLDTNTVTLGDGVQVGSRVQFVTPIHPVDDVEMRAAGWERSAPIVVGDNVWIAAGVTVCAGVTIEENSVIGAGSVVTRDIPANVLAVGTPCRPVRELHRPGEPGIPMLDA